jgi:hypothetical protein
MKLTRERALLGVLTVVVVIMYVQMHLTTAARFHAGGRACPTFIATS